MWDLATEQCLKIFRGNSLLHAVTGLAFLDHTALVVNTSTSIHLLNFSNTDADPAAAAAAAATGEGTPRGGGASQTVGPSGRREGGVRKVASAPVGALNMSMTRTLMPTPPALPRSPSARSPSVRSPGVRSPGYGPQVSYASRASPH